jgi:hypothetical protein
MNTIAEATNAPTVWASAYGATLLHGKRRCRQAPTEVDRKVTARGAFAEHDLRHDPDPEDDQDERAEKLGKELAKEVVFGHQRPL